MKAISTVTKSKLRPTIMKTKRSIKIAMIRKKKSLTKQVRVQPTWRKY